MHLNFFSQNRARLLLVLFAVSILSVFVFSGTPAAPEKSLGVGDKAPQFQLNDDRGRMWSLSEEVGEKPLVLYFYPAAMTKGCTKQACSYRDNRGSLQKEGVRVIGISGDVVRNLQYFRSEHNLNFTLLSDPDGSVARKFGVPVREGGTIQRTVNGEKKTLVRGGTFARWTFVIDRNGSVAYVNKDVTPEQDSENVLSVVDDLNENN